MPGADGADASENLTAGSAESSDTPDAALAALPLVAEKPDGVDVAAVVAEASPKDEASDDAEAKLKKSKTSAKADKKTDQEDAHEEVKLSNRRWTTLVLFKNNAKGEAPLPDDFPIWNYPKGYQFQGSAHDQHRLGNFKIDGEFIVRDGYLRREFGNTALLHLPEADNFELEGIASFEGIGGWLILVGWDIDSKSGYVIYNTKLRSNISPWFAIEIKDGKPVPNTEHVMVDRRVQGEGALRMRIDDKKLSMQVADAYLCKDEELPNYHAGHVAIGTFSPRYGPQNIGIKSLRMKLIK